MVDYFIRINSKGEDPYEDTSLFENDNLKKVIYENSWIQIFGYCYKNNSTLQINEKDIIFVSGDIYPRFGEPVKKDELLKELKKSKLEIRKFKGNFIVFHADLEKKLVNVYNSQLGIKHLYFGSNGDGILIGNNLNLFRKDFPEINKTALLQHILFTYTITHETFLKGVSRLAPGEIICSGKQGIETELYFDLQTIILNNQNRPFNIDEFTELFNSCVKQRAKENIHVSFTGGFDGRTIISSLKSQAVKFKSYSFGKEDGENTRVPLEISKELKLNYNPVYLEQEYENKYLESAKKVIYFSDGLSFNERANYIYAFEKLSSSGTDLLSGLIGGEILRPVHLRTDYLNEYYYRTIYLGKKIDYRNYLSEIGILEFLNYDFSAEFGDVEEVIMERVKDLREFRMLEKGYMYYLYDLMNLGFRMYYGTEIHYERAYCNNMTPYYDLDLIEYLFSTDYTEIYRNAFKGSKIFRWQGQKIYPEIIKRNYPELNKYEVDRGYPPGYLLNPFKTLLIPFKYNKRKRNRIKHIDFDEAKWSKIFINDFLNTGGIQSDIFNIKELTEECRLYVNGYTEHDSNMTRLVSLLTWLEMK